MRIVALASFALVLACGAPTAGERSPVGVYRLQTINGQGAPWVLQQSAVSRADLLETTLTLRTDLGYTIASRIQITTTSGPTTGTDTDGGTYTVDGATVATHSASGAQAFYAWAGSTLTQTSAGAVSVYAR